MANTVVLKISTKSTLGEVLCRAVVYFCGVILGPQLLYVA